MASLLYEMFRCDYDFFGYIDDVYEHGYLEKVHGLKKLKVGSDLDKLVHPGVYGVIAITEVSARKKYAEMARKADLPLATLVAKSAIVSESASLGQGCIVRN